MSDDSKNITVPKWDGKAETCPRYLAKISALAEYYGCGDALDETEMTNCPNETEFKSLVASSTQTNDEKKKIQLYKQNKRLCAIITLGQDSDHGLAAIRRTVAKGTHPHGLAYKFMNILEEKHRPCDASAKIALAAELRAIPFKMAGDYYNEVVGAMARYDVNLTETDLIEHLSEKVREVSLARMVIEHLNKPKTNHSLEDLCKDIAAVQRLAKIGGINTSIQKQKEKETYLVSTDEKNSEDSGEGKRNNSKDGKANKTCKHCGKKGHVESGCWKKDPEKAPSWYRQKNDKEAQETSAVEITL